MFEDIELNSIISIIVKISQFNTGSAQMRKSKFEGMNPFAFYNWLKNIQEVESQSGKTDS